MAKLMLAFWFSPRPRARCQRLPLALVTERSLQQGPAALWVGLLSRWCCPPGTHLTSSGLLAPESASGADGAASQGG